MFSPRLTAVVLLLLVSCCLLRAAPGEPDAAYEVRCSRVGTVRVIARQADGRLLVGGDFVFVNGVRRPSMARLHADGSVDASFNAGDGITRLRTYYTDTVQALAVQADGRILVGGLFHEWNGAAVSHLIRLNADGSRDAAFGPVTFDANASGVYALGLQGDGRILVGGYFASVQGVAKTDFARLNADGTLDTGFPVTVNAGVSKIVPDGGGGWWVGGSFSLCGGVPRAGLARLLANGDPDPAFVIGAGADAAVRAIAVRSDGEIFLTGDFQMLNGLARARLAQIAPDGAVRTGFDPQLGLNATGYALAVETSGALLVGGAFTAVNGLARFGLARVATTAPGALPVAPPAPATFSATAVASNQILLLWSAVPTAAGFVVERSADGLSGWLTLGSPGAGATTFTDPTAVPWPWRAMAKSGSAETSPASARPPATGWRGCSQAARSTRRSTRARGRPAPSTRSWPKPTAA